MKRLSILCAGLFLLAACQDASRSVGPEAVDASFASSAAGQAEMIVLLDPAFALGAHAQNQAAARAIAAEFGITPRHAYGTAVFGFSGVVPEGRLQGLERDPRVVHVEPVEAWPLAVDFAALAAAQALPTGIDRTETDQTLSLGTRVSVSKDVAIVDTGIDLDHPDLNVGQAVSFSGGDGNDKNGHGTHVAGTVAAKDDGAGVVGIAPGATVHAVQVCKPGGLCFTGDIVAGIDWVADQKGSGAIDFAAANMSISTSDEDFTCDSGNPGAVHQAICNVVGKGVVFSLAAGNDAREKKPYPEAFAISALADFNGKAGGGAAATCRSDTDETRANFSNWGSGVDVMAPGVCILSTWNDGGTNTISGTSMAAPHAAGAVALYLHVNGQSPATTAAGVAAIEDDIRSNSFSQSGSCGYANDSGSQSTENLLATNSSAFAGTNEVCEGATDGGGDGGGGDGGGGDTGTVYVWAIDFAQKDYGPGGSFHDLMTTVTVKQDSDENGTAEESDAAAASVTVEMTLTHDTDGDTAFECGTDDDCWNFSGSTDSNGQVTFTLKRAPTGTYQAAVTSPDSGLDQEDVGTYTLE